MNTLSKDCSGKQNKDSFGLVLCFLVEFHSVPGFHLVLWIHLVPGRLPLGSGRGDVEFACVFAPVASVAVSFVPELIFWNPVEKTN